MIDRTKLENFMFDLDEGECNTCGKKCEGHFCCDACEDAYKDFKALIKEL